MPLLYQIIPILESVIILPKRSRIVPKRSYFQREKHNSAFSYVRSPFATRKCAQNKTYIEQTSKGIK